MGKYELNCAVLIQRPNTSCTTLFNFCVRPWVCWHILRCCFQHPDAWCAACCGCPPPECMLQVYPCTPEGREDRSFGKCANSLTCQQQLVKLSLVSFSGHRLLGLMMKLDRWQVALSC